MKVVFRVDASLEIGTGHVMRCLTLANALRERGAHCLFLSRRHTGHLLDAIEARGHAVAMLPASQGTAVPVQGAPARPGLHHAGWLGTDWQADVAQCRAVLQNTVADWLVVDHYALDRAWEQAMRSHCRRLMVIDDLADRAHDCELLLDQNLGREASDYQALLPRGTQMLLCPRYALLRPEFAEWREYSLARRSQPQLKKLLIAMGGVDQGNVTGQILDVLRASVLPPDLNITVVMGTSAPWVAHVQAQAADIPRPTQVLAGISNMAQLMAESDLAIGAAGSTSWERCCLGLPTIVIVLAENQKPGAAALQEAGAAVIAKSIGHLHEMITTMTQEQDQSTQLLNASLAARRLTDGGGSARVMEAMYA